MAVFERPTMKWFTPIIVLLLAPSVALAIASIRVVDENGRPVDDFQVALVYRNVFSNERGENGRFKIYDEDVLNDTWAINVLIGADGYAPGIERFLREDKQQIRDGTATIVLRRGGEVRLRLRMPRRMELPPDLIPQVYFPEFARHAQINWGTEAASRPNGIVIRSSGNNEFVFRMPKERRDFFIGIHRPGWLRFCELGPFSIDDFIDGKIEVDVPSPSGINADFDLGGFKRNRLPFQNVKVDFGWRIPRASGSYMPVRSEPMAAENASLRIDDLAPGSYRLSLVTVTENDDKPRRADEIDPARFMERHTIELQAGQTQSVQIAYRPFDSEAFRGNRTARIRFRAQDGSPATGTTIRVAYLDGHYGALTVFEGQVPDDDIVLLQGITDRVPPGDWPGSYVVQVDGGQGRKRTLGYFHLESNEALQEFEFGVIATPDIGDKAPDIVLTEIGSGNRVRFNDLSGKIVFVEFWATWCGPCQEPMEKLNELARVHQSEWNEDVAIVPISIDELRDEVRLHVEQRGWTHLPHYWSGADAPSQLSAKSSFAVTGVPMALLIDRDGKIVWRGHLGSIDLAQEIAMLRAK